MGAGRFTKENSQQSLIDDYLNRGGKITTCPTAVAKGAKLNELTREDLKRKKFLKQ